MTIRHYTKEEIENLKDQLPPRDWDLLTRNAEDPDQPTDEELAYALYKSPSGWYLQSLLKSRDVQQAELRDEPIPTIIKGEKSDNRRTLEHIRHLDALIQRNKIPEGLEDKPVYRGGRISYGTALIKSGKKPGDVIRDPRYQSFSINPGTAMYHTSVSQYGDKDSFMQGLAERDPHDPAFQFKRKKKVLLEHYPRAGETALYGGSEDPELEIIYPRNKQWKITNVRDEDVTFSIKTGENPIEGKQNVRIYTVERKKKKLQPIIKRKIQIPKVKKSTLLNINFNFDGLNNLLYKPKKKSKK
jgi:hypothetical protein